MPDDTAPELLEYNEENVYKVIAEFLQKVSDGDSTMAETLKDPQRAIELLWTKIVKPANAGQYVFVFQDPDGPNDRFTVGALPRIGEPVDVETQVMCSWRVTKAPGQ